MGFDFAVHECRNFDYFIKTDDDVYLNMDRVAYFISQQKKAENMMAGNCRHNIGPSRLKTSKYYLSEADYPGNVFPQFCAGTFYLMSMDIAKTIYRLV